VTFSISLIFNGFIFFSNMVYKVTKFYDEIKRGVWGDIGGEEPTCQINSEIPSRLTLLGFMHKESEDAAHAESPPWCL
jgi:hypothetical protein